MGTAALPVDPVELDHLADAAWPALVREPLGRWMLRATHGVTNRANSVLTAASRGASAGRDLARDFDAVESFYRRHSLSPCFYISPATEPPELDAALAERGYLLEKPTEVWTADAPRSSPPTDVVFATTPDPAWFDCAFDEPQPRRAIHEAIVRRINRPCTFASIRKDNQVVSCGLAVADHHWAGIFCMSTRPDYRRNGMASHVLSALATSANEQGARRLYLQVMKANAPAAALYRRFGFRFAYPYHYRYSA